MYAKRFYRRRPRKYIRRRKTISKRRSAVSTRIKRYVKRELHRNLENKERVNYASNQSIITSDATTCTYPLLVATGNSTNEDGRLGNQFKVVKGQLKMCINLKNYDATTNPYPVPVWVKIWIIRDMVTQSQQATLPSGIYNNFFRAGATTYSFGGTPLDIVSETNKEFFRVLSTRTFKLGTSYPGNNGGANWYSDNSPMCKYLTINWGKWCKKQIKCSDGSSYPTNHNLYIVFQAVNADGTSCSGKTMVEWHYTNLMQFEDA